jgi:hypothetical protein
MYLERETLVVSPVVTEQAVHAEHESLLQDDASVRSLMLLFVFAWNFGAANLPMADFIGGVPTTVLRWGATGWSIAWLVCQGLADARGARLMSSFAPAFLLALVTVVLSKDLAASILEYLRYAGVAALGGVIYLRGRDPGLLTSFRIVSSFLVGASLVQILLAGELTPSSVMQAMADGGRLRSAGLTMHPNNLGYLSVVMIITSMWTHAMRWRGALLAVEACVALLALMASGSRAALLAAVLVFLLQVLVRPLASNRVRAVVINTWNFGVVIFLFCSLVFFQVLPMHTLIEQPETLKSATNSSFDESDKARQEMWENAWQEFLADPIKGQGFGLQILETYNELERSDQYAKYAHNAPLNALQSGGILFGAVLLMVYWVTAKAIARILLLAQCVNCNALFNLRAFLQLLTLGLVASAVDGCLQGNFGMSAVFSLCLGATYVSGSMSDMILNPYGGSR